MSDQPNNNDPKKVSLADAVRNKLAQKKQAQADARANPQAAQANMTMKSQMTKKVNNQRRRTGGS